MKRVYIDDIGLDAVEVEGYLYTVHNATFSIDTRNHYDPGGIYLEDIHGTFHHVDNPKVVWALAPHLTPDKIREELLDCVYPRGAA